MQLKTYLIGYTSVDFDGLLEYLKDTDNEAFYAEIIEAVAAGVSEGECLCSFYAKLCYKSLSEGKNANITKIRAISDNLKGVFDSRHGSVFEHCCLNFVTKDCSRVFTHELVRHRVGTAFSQTSGRYVAIDKIDIVLPPEMEKVRDQVEEHAVATAVLAKKLRAELIPEGSDFTFKKRMTSAIRRIAPNGQTNEIGWSCNIRALRHLIELRTARHAEWEIRYVFNEVAAIILKRWPGILYGHEAEDTGDGLVEYTNLRV
jgi:thymidylate synthase (FAD)